MTESSWHDALDLAVPELAAPQDMLQRLEHAVRVHRRRRRGAAAGSALLVAAVVVSAVLAPGLWRQGGKAQPATGSGPTASRPAPTTSAAHPVSITTPCQATDDPTGSVPATKPLAADFKPTQAFLCVDSSRAYPGDGSWSVLLGQRLTGDLQPLIQALRHPAELTRLTPSAGPGGALGGSACAYSYLATPTIVLYDAAGTAVRATFPRDDCGQPRPAVSAALAALHRTTIQVLKLRQEQTQAQTLSAKAAAKVGCQPQWKDEFSMAALASVLSAGAPISWQTAEVTACLFADNGSDPTVGDFVAGRRLTAADREKYLIAVGLPGHQGTCATDHREFVVFTSGHGYASVEVGGCWRVQRQDGGVGSLGSANGALVQELVGSLSG